MRLFIFLKVIVDSLIWTLVELPFYIINFQSQVSGQLFRHPQEKSHANTVAAGNCESSILSPVVYIHRDLRVCSYS